MKILLIYPNITHQEAISPGLAYISGWLKKNHDYDIRLFDFTWGATLQEFNDFLKRFNPEIIGITLGTFDFFFVKQLIKGIRKISRALIVLGGIHPTVAPDECIEYADVICIGEGERAFEELVEKIDTNEDYSKIENLWVKKDNQIYKNNLRKLDEDLDSIPIDRDLFEVEKSIKGRNYVVDIYAGRGCPHNCYYCINYFKRTLYKDKGKFLRLRSPQNVINEILDLKKKYKLKLVSFPDDSFTYNKKWLLEFCDLYKKQIKLPFICLARVENITDQVCRALKDANCTVIEMGVESGSEKIRKEVLNRHMSNEQIINAFKLCKKYGIKTFSFNMVGIPYEKKEDMMKTVALNRILQPEDVQVTIFQPYPGSELYKRTMEKGWISQKRVEEWAYGSIMNYDHISAKEIKKIRDSFPFNVYIRNNLKKAIMKLIQGKFYNKYIDFRSKTPVLLRRIIQWVANRFIYQ